MEGLVIHFGEIKRSVTPAGDQTFEEALLEAVPQFRGLAQPEKILTQEYDERLSTRYRYAPLNHLLPALREAIEADRLLQEEIERNKPKPKVAPVQLGLFD